MDGYWQSGDKYFTKGQAVRRANLQHPLVAQFQDE